jgi:septal ring factor EnvC (AmiA/AmiB activator)
LTTILQLYYNKLMNELITIPNQTFRETHPDVISIKNLAEKKIDTFEATKFTLKEKRRELRETLRAEDEFAQLEKNIKEAQKKLKEVKNRLMQDPELIKLEAEIKELAKENKAAKADVSDYLVMYADMTGQLSFLHGNGDMIMIKKQAKIALIKKKPIYPL